MEITLINYDFHSFLIIFQGRIEQWIDFASLEIDSNILAWFRPRIGRAAYLPPVSKLL